MHLVKRVANFQLTRRGFCQGAASLGAAWAYSSQQALAERLKAETSLGTLAAEKGILFGASFAVSALDGDTAENYAAMYIRDTRILTSELAFKLQELRPAADQLDFYNADRFVEFAEKHAQKVRGHTLIWNDALPDWIKSLSPTEAGELLDKHIETVVTRYGARVAYWDVVNEPIGPWDGNPGNLRGGPFYEAYGEDYIKRAFDIARKFAPTGTLVINEAQTETADDNGATFRKSLLELLHRLKDQGAPIDAVGIQSHLKTAAHYDFPAFAAFLSEIAGLGYAIHITELDVNDTGAKGSIAERDRQVAALYLDYLNQVLTLDAVKVVELWQLSDGASWLRDPATVASMKVRRDARPLIYDADFKKKPAWDAVATAFQLARTR